MAAKTSWHRYGTKLRHCRSMYTHKSWRCRPSLRKCSIADELCSASTLPAAETAATNAVSQWVSSFQWCRQGGGGEASPYGWTSKNYVMKTFIHRKYTVDIDRIQICTKDKNITIIRNIHCNMAVARFLTTTLWLCCALYRKFLCLLTIVSATSDWPVYLYISSNKQNL